jgi:ribonuclease-3 family protein
MEESINSMSENLTESIKKSLDLKNVEPRQLSPLVLAYIGDSIYDLVIRTYVVNQGNMQVNKMNRHACMLVKAQTQSELIGIIESELTEEEDAVYKRGRNAKSYTSAKNASIGDYRRATGFEALMGYLYLSGEFNRMMELVVKGLQGIGELCDTKNL